MIKNNLENYIDLLSEVKRVDFIYNNYLTVKDVSEYFQVSAKAINTVIERNNNEFELNEIKIMKNEDLKKLKSEYKNKIESRTSKILLINKIGILKIAYMLKESLIANKIKEKINIFVPRKEIVFKEKLDLYLNKLKNEYILRRKEICLNDNINLKMFEYETQKYFDDNRVDFYFPFMKLVVEYDENYHNFKSQNLLDLRRESEIILNIEKTRFGYFEEIINNTMFYYIPDEPYIYFNSVKNKEYFCCKESKEKFKNNRENYVCESCGYADISKINGLGKIIRIKYGEEDIGLIKLFSYIMSEAVGF